MVSTVFSFLLLHNIKGRHNCFWCDITSLELNDSRINRTPVKRSLQQLESDFQYFKEELQSDVVKAKENRNVIDSCYFDVPLDQVRIKVNALYVSSCILQSYILRIYSLPNVTILF